MCVINPVPDKPLSRTVLMAQKTPCSFNLSYLKLFAFSIPFHTDQSEGGKTPIASGTTYPGYIAGNVNSFGHFQHSPASLHMGRGGSLSVTPRCSPGSGWSNSIFLESAALLLLQAG